MANDPVSGTASSEATYKLKEPNKKYEIECGVKSDGSKTTKATAKKLIDNTKLKATLTYNPWVDIFNVSAESDFEVDKFHATVAYS